MSEPWEGVHPPTWSTLDQHENLGQYGDSVPIPAALGRMYTVPQFPESMISPPPWLPPNSPIFARQSKFHLDVAERYEIESSGKKRS